MTHAAQTNFNTSTRGFRTVITFRTQQLLDFFVNEMQGQISDGYFESRRNTNWLWERCGVRLGDKTEVAVKNLYIKGAVNLPLNAELWEYVGDRIMENFGFANKREATKAWKEILDAIKTARVMTEDEYNVYWKDCENRAFNIKEALREDVLKTVEKLREYFGEESVRGQHYSNAVEINNQIKDRAIILQPQFYLSSAKVGYKMYVDHSEDSIRVGTFENILKAVELFKDFYRRKEELMKK